MVNAIWLLMLCAAMPASTTALNGSIKDDQLDLAGVTLHIAREHLSKVSSTIVVVEQSTNPESAMVHDLFLDYILPRLQGPMAVQLHIGDDTKPLWEYFIIVIDSLKSFRIIQLSFPEFQHRNLYFLIIFTKYMDSYRDIENIFVLCHRKNIINVNIITHHPALGVSMFTYKLFSEGRCRVVQPMLHFRFNQSFENLKVIFPKKIFNLHGCPVRVAGRIVEPLLTFAGDLNNPKPVGRWKNLSGIEGMLLKSIAETLNFSIEMRPFSTGPYAENYSNFECFNELLEGRADLAVGAFGSSDPIRESLISSKIYHQSPFIFVVRGGRIINSIERLARPFKYSVWIFLGFLLASGTIIVQILRPLKPVIRRFVFGARNDTPTTNFIAIFLGYPISRAPRRNFARFLLMLWLLLTLILRNAYQGALYDAIRMDKFIRIPSGYDDLVKWNYKFYLYPEFNRFGILPKNLSTIPASGNFLQRYKILEEKTGKYVTVSLRDNYVDYMTKTNKSDLWLIDEVIYMYQMVMYFPTNSIYLAEFNEVLQGFISSGIAGYIKSRFGFDYALFKNSQKNQPKSLENSRLKPLYQIYAVMMMVAVVVFGLELLSFYSRGLRRIIEWIN